MKLRTLRTLDEVNTFYAMIQEHYPCYQDPKISPIHYGVFDGGDSSEDEGGELVAGSAISIDGQDFFVEGGVKHAEFDSLIVKPEFRQFGIGTALFNFMVQSHCDLTVRLAVSPQDELLRLVSWYERFGFYVIGDNGDVIMERDPDDDPYVDAHELRTRVVDFSGTSRLGLDLDKFWWDRGGMMDDESREFPPPWHDRDSDTDFDDDIDDVEEIEF